jgi:hypothetical protein
MWGIPWQLILNPNLLSAAGDLVLKARRRPDEIRTATDLNGLRERLAELAKDEEAQAELVKQLSERLNGVAEVARTTASKTRASLILGSTGLAIGVAALILALLR